MASAWDAGQRRWGTWLLVYGLVLHIDLSLHASLPAESPQRRTPEKRSPPRQQDPVFTASLRATEAATAITEEMSAQHWKPGMANLAAGSPFWSPPKQCLNVAKQLLEKDDPEIHRYGDARGLPELRKKLEAKLKNENGIVGREVMVTAGANQAFVNVVMAVCDPGDSVLVFAPYYFSHRVALELAQVNMVVCEHDDNWSPQIELVEGHIEEAASSDSPIKMVVLVSPGNPSGAVLEKGQLKQLVQLCRDHGVWLLSDETFENFLYDDAAHVSPDAPDGVINVYSFSKAYGMAGWRVGYVAYPPHLSGAMLKAQDTIQSMAPMLSQRVALAALDAGPSWVKKQVEELQTSRNAILEAVEPLNAVPSKGSFFFVVKLPSMINELDAVRLLADRHSVLVTPGAAFGVEGHLRVSYGAVRPQEAVEVADRLTNGLAEIVRAGLLLTFDMQLSTPYSNGRVGPWGQLLGSEQELIQKEQGGVEGLRVNEDD